MAKAEGYIGTWTFRSAALAHMRCANIQRLSGWKQLSIAEFSAMAPDQKGWIAKAHRQLRSINQKKGIQQVITVENIMQFFGSTGPVELLSMETCLAADSGMNIFSDQFLNTHMDLIIQLGHKYEATTGVWPCAVIQAQLAQQHLKVLTDPKDTV